ncbi:hypothetical protein IQ259_17775 [Fortiea sp. LEGE XX443]|uniref:hypothetical protein n=1 Tax=Fortiea sp. LEGE XX443 TaxID=1828611 RepID=UPI00187F64F0|nr:hypothetical protein [Fortiea sp. LEGE XX443]MBE9006866.1 hypothetical protein [Fortiea sp. LEGE XX443]
MITVVVVINILISLLLLYGVWLLWKLKQQIAFIADRLTAYEKYSHTLLSQAPQNIDISQKNIHNLRQRNQSLQLKIQQVRQIVSLLLLGQRVGQRYFRQPNFFFLRKKVAKAGMNHRNISG